MGAVTRLVTEELVVGASMNCQSWPLKLVAPCAWYKTPGSPVQVRTTLPALTLILTFEAGLTAGAEIATRRQSDPSASARTIELADPALKGLLSPALSSRGREGEEIADSLRFAL